MEAEPGKSKGRGGQCLLPKDYSPVEAKIISNPAALSRSKNSREIFPLEKQLLFFPNSSLPHQLSVHRLHGAQRQRRSFVSGAWRVSLESALDLSDSSV